MTAARSRRHILEPLRVIAPSECRQSAKDVVGYIGLPTNETVECPSCEKRFHSAAVVTGEINQDPDGLGHFRHRKCFCDHCNHIFHWLQSCTAEGQLVPVLLSGPGLVRSPSKINAFLAAHPEAAGVLQNCQ